MVLSHLCSLFRSFRQLERVVFNINETEQEHVGFELTARLPVGVADVNVVGPMCVVAHEGALFTGVLVGLLHIVCVPVCPVDPVLKQGYSKDMRERAGDGAVSVLPVHVCKAVCRVDV